MVKHVKEYTSKVAKETGIPERTVSKIVREMTYIIKDMSMLGYSVYNSSSECYFKLHSKNRGNTYTVRKFRNLLETMRKYEQR